MTTPRPLRLIAFPGAPNLPVFAAIERGCYAAEGLEVQLTLTPSSAFQAEGLMAGRFDMAATAFDNVVAYRAGQGAVTFAETPDLVAVMGATRLELSLVVAPDVETFADLRGRSLALDALSTGFAFVLHHMLEAGGLAPGDCRLAAVGATPQRWEAVRDGTHAGTLTIEPFTTIAARAGYRVLDSSERHFAHYQGGIFAARRSWADANRPAMEGFIRGTLAGLGWVLDPANRAAAAQVLVANMPQIKPGLVEAVLAKLLSEKTGLTPGGAVDWAGVDTVLGLRARFGGGGPLEAPTAYFDLSYYEHATA